MLTNDDDIKATLLDSILRSSVPHGWINNTDAVYVFNEVTVTVRYSGDDLFDVEILDFEDLS